MNPVLSCFSAYRCRLLRKRFWKRSKLKSMAVSTNLPDHPLCPLFNCTVWLTGHVQLCEHFLPGFPALTSTISPFSLFFTSVIFLLLRIFCWQAHNDTQVDKQFLIMCSSLWCLLLLLFLPPQQHTVGGNRSEWEEKDEKDIFLYIAFFPPVNHTINYLCREFLFFGEQHVSVSLLSRKRMLLPFSGADFLPLFSFFFACIIDFSLAVYLFSNHPKMLTTL